MDFKKYITENILRIDYSRRGGGIEIDAQKLFPYIEDARISAYQNYLGGGLLGAVCSDNNFKSEVKKEDLKKFDKLEDILKRYFQALTNEEAEEWDEWSSTSYDNNQRLPKSAF